MNEGTRTQAVRTERMILAFAALFLPALSLIPLGGLYLWKEGYLLWWAFAALVVVTSISLIEWLMFRRPVAPAVPPARAASEPVEAPADVSVERAAWRSVRAIERDIDIDKLDSGAALGDLANRIVRAVASHYHPERTDAIWRFTLPQALAISEQVSRRLRATVHETVPFGDRLTLAQVLAAYRFRGAIDVVERLYDVWRVVRLINPATAVANEARDRLSKAALNWGREHVTRRLAAAFVEEVGRASIDLYSGRLDVPTEAAGVSAAPGKDSAPADASAPAAPAKSRHEKKPSALTASWSLARFLLRRKKADDAPVK